MAFYSGSMFAAHFFAPAYFGQLFPIAPLPPALPSTRRRVVVQDNIDVYPVEDYDFDEADSITFDFSHRLSPYTLTDAEEVISSIVEFILSSETDVLVSARVLGTAAFENSLVSQKFGNWLNPGAYQADVKLLTTRGNVLGSSASFIVNPEH